MNIAMYNLTRLRELLINFQFADGLESEDDRTIADMLLNEVWADMDVTKRESAIIAEAIRRLGGPAE